MRQAKKSTGIVLTLLSCLATLACSKADIRPERIPSADRAPEEKPVIFPRLTSLPAPYDALGKPCAPSDNGCGTDGKLAVVYNQTFTEALPPGLAMQVTAKGYRPRFGAEGTIPARLAFEEERVWLSHECLECRLAGFQVEVVALPTVKDTDLANFQTRLGLPAAPLLRKSGELYRAVLAQKRT